MLESQKWRAGGPSYKFSNRTIRSPSARELCQIQGYGWIWRIRFRAYEIFSTGNLSSWLFYTLWRSSICLNLKNGGLEASHTSSQIGRIRSPLARELCQIQGYGWIWKYFLPVICRADYSTHFGGPRYAWISKMASWRPVIQVLKSDVSGLLQLVSYVKLKVKAGSGGVVLGPVKYFPPVFSTWLFYTLWRSLNFLNLKNDGLEASHTSS